MQPPTQEARPLAPGDVIAGKFRLERIVGRGGMGAVWAGRHVQLDMLVALKFIEAEPAPGADPRDALVRFEREAKAAAQIRSPHVAQIIDHGVDTASGAERPYIAMELLEGEDLGERLRREGRLSVPATARILTQAAKALRRAHEAGIIHRDLKPGNVFLARFDDDEVVKVLDFGVAKMRRPGELDQGLATQTGIVFGSPTYMSPEQARGVRDIDHRTDLWSLAVIVFRAVTGVKPFQGASIADIVIKLCIDPLPIATRLAPDLPPAIDRFFERAFARDPDKRFATAPEMAAAFEAVASGAAATPQAPAPPQLPALTQSGQHPQAPAVLQALPAPAPAPLGPFTPSGGIPASASGPNLGFAAGTLTPPPRPVGAPDPTPGSGSAALPSDEWGLPDAPPPAPADDGADPPTPARGVPLAPLAEPPPPGPAPSAVSAIARLLPVRSRPALLAALSAGAVMGVLLVVLAVRRGPAGPEAGALEGRGPTPTSTGIAAPCSVPAAPETATAPAVNVAAESAPAATAAEAAPAASASAAATPAEAAAGGAAEAEPTATATAAPAAPAAAPKGGTKEGGTKAGKKKKPNFGY